MQIYKLKSKVETAHQIMLTTAKKMAQNGVLDFKNPFNIPIFAGCNIV